MMVLPGLSSMIKLWIANTDNGTTWANVHNQTLDCFNSWWDGWDWELNRTRHISVFVWEHRGGIYVWIHLRSLNKFKVLLWYRLMSTKVRTFVLWISKSRIDINLVQTWSILCRPTQSCADLRNLVQTYAILYRPAQSCTDLRNLVQTCTILYRPTQSCADLLNLVQTCAILCRPAQSCADLRNLVQTCAILCRPAQSCIDLRNLVQTCSILCRPA